MVRFNLLKTFCKVVKFSSIIGYNRTLPYIYIITTAIRGETCRKTRPDCCDEYIKETCTEYCDSNPCNGRGSNQRLLHMSTPYSPM